MNNAPNQSEYDEFSYEPLPAEPAVVNQSLITDLDRQLPIIEL